MTTLENNHEAVHEILENLKEEDGSQLTLYNCKKKTDHRGFIPVTQFRLKDLPEAYQKQNVVDLIKALSELTVKIDIDYTSEDRPEFIPCTNIPYPNYPIRGSKTYVRTATGRVWNVTKYTEGNDDYVPCTCPGCAHSSKDWWKIEVMTANHVVFDNSEAEKSVCTLWFDDDFQTNIDTILGWKLGEFDKRGDWCILTCVTHDADVGEILQKKLEIFNNLCNEVMTEYEIRRETERLTIIVSHPHSHSKQISIGYWIHRKLMQENFSYYTYTASTCDGSSGACVYRLGWLSPHPHFGQLKSGLNCSGKFGDLPG